MADCYQLVPCFWVAHQGSCEDISNWDPLVTVDADQPCSSWTDENKCWDVEKCFWNGRVHACQEMGGPLVTTAMTSTKRPSRRATPRPTRSTRRPTNRPTTTTTSRPKPCIYWPEEQECWNHDECFWNGRTRICSEMGQMAPPHTAPVVTDQPHATHTTRKPSKRPSKKPTARPTKLIPMNICETLSDEAACSANEDCMFDRASQGCFAITDGDCGRLPDAAICQENEDCHWSAAEQKCKGECDGFRSAHTCANGEDCLWSTATAECLSVFASCNRFRTAQDCLLNEVCFWSKSATCESYFSPCGRMETPEDCAASAQFNEKCTWDEDPLVEDLFGCQDPFTTAPPIIECENIADEPTCTSSNATETNMPCVWHGGRCSEFQFDCEDFLTQPACDGKSFRGITCFWNGECDEYEENALQSIPWKLRQTRKSEEGETVDGFSPKMWQVGFGGFLVGLLLTILCNFARKRSPPEDMSLALI